jgi:SAM-dependent methyltransferase
MTNLYHEANKTRWNACADNWAKSADGRGLWKRCHREPGLVLSEHELRHLRGLSGRRVCVLGSGDNQAVFALAGLGADVTSVDISRNQLDIARGRAGQLGLAVRFLQADVTDLSCLDSELFDAVYTGGHVAVWVCDLEKYYREAARVLKPGGLFIVNEYHPFRRIWRDSPDSLAVGSSYYDRGPFEYDLSDEVLHEKPGGLKCYEFHWTVSDFIGAVMKAGCQVIEVMEFGEDTADWEGAPMKGLPENLLVVAKKDAR